MTINIALSSNEMGFLESSHDTYANAVAGANLVVGSAGDRAGVGQWRLSSNPNTFTILQSFMNFPYVHDATQRIASAYFQLYRYPLGNTAPTPRDVGVRIFNWGSSVGTGDWRTPTQLNALPVIAALDQYQEWTGTNTIAQAGSTSFESTGILGQLTSTSTIRTVWYSQRNLESADPNTNGNDERVFFKSDTETGFEPRLIWHTLPVSTLSPILGAAAQLSDGTHVFLEWNSAMTEIHLKHNNGSAASTNTTISSTGLSTFERLPTGQGMTLTVDRNDNIYVIGQRNNGSGDLRARAWVKGSGHNWTMSNVLSGVLPSGLTNQYATAWHPQGGTNGTLMLIAARQAHKAVSSDPYWALLSCDAMLNGFGSLIKAADNRFGVIEAPPVPHHRLFWNSLGTNLDVASAPNSARGFIVCAMFDTVSMTRYSLNSAGNYLLNTTIRRDDAISPDAAGKMRVLALTDSLFGKSYGNYPFDIWQNIGTSGSVNPISSATATLLEDNVSTLTGITPSTFFASNAAWDTIYDPDDNKLWVYYFDVASNRRLIKTGFNATTGQPTFEQIEVATNIGAVGSTNLAIRLPRGRISGSKTHVAVANRTSGGVHSTIYLYDVFNAAPFAPSLVHMDNYDAGNARVFSWAFQDPNSGDTQSAYEMEIRRVSDGVVIVGTGKVTSTTSSRTVAASTLTNGVAYQWRVRTWDFADLQGPYSDYDAFSTVAGGTVTITDPAADNPADQIVSSYEVHWSVSGATQQDYRVRMINSSNEEVLSDTGWITSVATSHLVSGIPSDIQVRFEVTVRNAGVESSPGTRLYTTSYATPLAPVISVTPMPNEGYILIGVENPDPPGDVAQVLYTQVLRRRTDDPDSEPYVLVGNVGVNGSLRDYTAAGGVEYSYIGRGQAP